MGLYVTAYYVGGTFGGAIPGYFWNSGGWPACVAFIVLAQALTGLLVGRCWQDRAPATAPLNVAEAIS